MQKLKDKRLYAINWLGNYFETDMAYVAKSGFWMTVGQISAVVMAFGLSVFFANFVSKDFYGQYKFILSAIGILGTLSLTGMPNVLTQAIAKGKEGMLRKTVSLSFKWSFIMVLVGLSMSIYYLLNGNKVLGFSFAIASVCLPIINSYGLYGTYFSGKKNFKLSTVYWIFSQLLLNMGIIAIALFSESVLSLVAVYFVLSAGSATWSYFHVISKYRPNTETDDSFLSYGKHVSFMNFFNSLANQLDKILVFHYLGAANLAIYAFSQAIPEQIKGSYKNLFNIALPKYAVLDEANLRSSIMKKTWQLTLITIVIVAVYIVLAPFVFELFFPKYTEAVIYSQIYMLGLIAIPGISLFGIYFQIKKDAKTMYKLTTISNLITIALTFVLIYNFGLKGAVIENGISWLIMLLVNYYFFATHKEDLSR
ncbi:MAG: oligosaccharide flippase family protein [Minisyncoccia bacterium]